MTLATWATAYPAAERSADVEQSWAGIVPVGRIGAIVGTLALPAIATSLGPAWSYFLVAAFWLAGAAAIAVYAARGGSEPAGRPLDAVSAVRLAGAATVEPAGS
jgi:hypothetical protein